MELFESAVTVSRHVFSCRTGSPFLEARRSSLPLKNSYVAPVEPAAGSVYHTHSSSSSGIHTHTAVPALPQPGRFPNLNHGALHDSASM